MLAFCLFTVGRLHSGLDPRSQKAATFAADVLFGKSYDYAIKQAVRHQQSLEEVLEHATIDKLWKQIVSPEKLAMGGGGDVDLEGGNAAKSAVLAALVPTESMTRLTLPENAQSLEAVEVAAAGARKKVKSQIQTVDGSASLEKLCKQMRNMDVCKLRGNEDASILVMYMVDAAGEHERDARRSPTPMRRDFLDKIIKAMMSTRGPLPDFDSDKLVFPQLDASDM